ncbi:hypothetical protein F5Y16DRAFT_57234 [Xylariaceae sp. FL0255]|nr:hypothetical protein F5Y16DRAFT_57234 [Xylariaceae sp. FL0255]
MSRSIIRIKAPTTPVKAKSRRGSDSSSSLDLSDDGGYSGLEDVTNSDEDDEDVEAAEEEHILSDELQQNQSSPRPNEDEVDDERDDDDEEDEDVDAEDSTTWEGLPSDPDELDINNLPPLPSAHIVRRVRFDVPESDDDDTETDEETATFLFPDIFVDKSRLDPQFRREVDRASEDDSDASYWDHYESSAWATHLMEPKSSMDEVPEEDNTSSATLITHNDPIASTSTPVVSPQKDDLSLDGYGSDGDTTDEEIPPPRPVRRKTRKEHVIEESEASDVEIIKGRRGQPRIGRFSLDKSSKKPIAVVHPKTGKMMIFTPRGGKGAFDLSPEQFQGSFGQAQSSPILGNPGNIMMSGMISSHTFGDFMNTHTIGPAEAWYSQFPDLNTFADTSSSEMETVDEEELNLNISDFIDIDEDSDSSDDQGEAVKDDVDDEIFRTPGRPTTASSDVTSLLDHFSHNTDLVGAFRRDQTHHSLITRNKATRDSLAFSGPYYEGTLRGIKDGRIATANVPISPLRRQKKAPELASSPLSSLSTKRKASSEHHAGHKRQRSVPDVETLTI